MSPCIFRQLCSAASASCSKSRVLTASLTVAKSSPLARVQALKNGDVARVRSMPSVLPTALGAVLVTATTVDKGQCVRGASCCARHSGGTRAT